MSMTIIKVLLVSLIQRFDFEPVNPDEYIKSKFAIYTVVDELNVRVKKSLLKKNTK